MQRENVQLYLNSGTKLSNNSFKLNGMLSLRNLQSVQNES